MSNTNNYSHGFSFEFLWRIATDLYTNSSSDSSLYHPLDNQSRITLTYKACVTHAGTEWSPFTRDDVYDRVILWRVPLVALVATTTLPALGLVTQVFTVLHLLADPIDTLWSLFYKLQLAKRDAQWASEADKHLAFTFKEQPSSFDGGAVRMLRAGTRAPTGLSGHEDMQDKHQRLLQAEDPCMKRLYRDVFASIVHAYGEWHLGDEAKEVIKDAFDPKWSPTARFDFRDRCATAAAHIAADRVARDLPSLIATSVFFVQVFAGFWKTLNTVGDSYDGANPEARGLNEAPHNIAFGTLFFWLPFAVLATAYVGGAQTENSVPRILGRLRRDAKDIHASAKRAASRSGMASSSVPATDHSQTNLLLTDAPEFPRLEYSMHERWSQGGLPTWQPDKFKDCVTHPWFFLSSVSLSIIIVIVPTIAAVWVSWRTPTEGFGCRATAQASFFVSWLLNHFLDWLLCYSIAFKTTQELGFWRKYGVFWATFVKDALLTAGTITMLAYTAVGVFNSCGCWSNWFPDFEKRYISFPQEPFVFHVIKHRLSTEYPAVIASALLIELIVFTIVTRLFHTGHQVLKQQDIDKVLASEGWWTKLKRKMAALMQSSRANGKRVAISPPSRTDTGEAQARSTPSWLQRLGRRPSSPLPPRVRFLDDEDGDEMAENPVTINATPSSPHGHGS